MDAEIMAIAETIMNTVDCEKIYLFGSFAYGEPHKDSDLDFYVVLPDDSNLRPIEAMRKIHRNLGNVKRKMPVDVLAARSSRFAEMSVLPTMERRIAREGVVLYEQGGKSENGMRSPRPTCAPQSTCLKPYIPSRSKLSATIANRLLKKR
ncbi:MULTISPECIES: nucleotidyltransferase domain-containing protein [unclassified Dehalobacter]|uniref:nucleotidyltransferase domain-containing protein n=1 Tax=unclassified Dehalobacter TaxID=2635733 RepID=UPI000EDD7CCF|nr:MULTISPECIES: nucleotidyltransferase domain-containing protein [unclassified Dehalobacter]RJE46633.1 hypothetical protein A7K50_12780 [Dehalobacter sp. MCB1]